jgi:hypothetical protein
MPAAAASQMVKGDLRREIIHHTEEASTLTEVSCGQPSSWHLLFLLWAYTAQSTDE